MRTFNYTPKPNYLTFVCSLVIHKFCSFDGGLPSFIYMVVYAYVPNQFFFTCWHCAKSHDFSYFANNCITSSRNLLHFFPTFSTFLFIWCKCFSLFFSLIIIIINILCWQFECLLDTKQAIVVFGLCFFWRGLSNRIKIQT